MMNHTDHVTAPLQRGRREAPRRRLLYHEFDIELSPYDYWLDESAEEQHARHVREDAERSGNCRFYHNCTTPLPPPLLLHTFRCLQPNVSNVTWLPVEVARQPELELVNEDVRRPIPTDAALAKHQTIKHQDKRVCTP